MKSLSPCTPIREWYKQRKGCRELLIVYGGMCSRDIEYLLEHMAPGSRVFWLECNEPLATPAIEAAVEKGLLALSGCGDEAIAFFFDLFDPTAGLDFVLLNAEQATHEELNRCIEQLQAIQEMIRLQTFNTGTLVVNGLRWQHNTLVNLPEILAHPGASVLEDRFSGKPAVVVGAGPSLNDAIPYLQELQDRFLIISTGTALAPLRNAGITPDLVMVVDASHLVEKQFTVPSDDLYFVGSTIVYPKVPGRFKGEFYSLFESNPIDQWLRENSKIDGALMAGGTVTASGMHLANQMGCDPIITVGLDLAYADDGSSHASGTMYHGVKRHHNQLTPVPGNWQDNVYTTRQFSCYIDYIKMYVRERPEKRFVNLTNGGARIEGMELHRMDYLPELAAEAFPAREVIAALHEEHRPHSADYMQDELERVVGFLDAVQKLCCRGAMTSNRLMLMKRFPERADPEEMRDCINAITEVDDALEHGRDDFEFLTMSLWPAAFELSSKSKQSEDDGARGTAVFGRSRKFYEQMAGSARWARELVLKCCSILEQRAA